MTSFHADGFSLHSLIWRAKPKHVHLVAWSTGSSGTEFENMFSQTGTESGSVMQKIPKMFLK